MLNQKSNQKSSNQKSMIRLSAVIVLLLTGFSAYAKDTKITPAAPVPPQIATATKVFIANTGGDNLGAITGGTVLSGLPSRFYDEFYAAMKDWGRYEIVSTPANADLILEINWSLLDIQEPLNAVSKTPADLGRLSLTIVDRETRITLWAFHEHVRNGVLLSNRDKNFELTMSDLVNDMKNLAPAAGAANKSSN